VEVQGVFSLCEAIRGQTVRSLGLAPQEPFLVAVRKSQNAREEEKTATPRPSPIFEVRVRLLELSEGGNGTGNTVLGGGVRAR